MSKQHLIAKIYNPVIADEYGGAADVEGGTALGALMGNLFRVAIVVGGLALLLMIVWGGISWITAGGDKGKVEEARNRITNGIIGLAILVGTVAIALFVGEVLGINLLNPTLPIPE